MMVVASLFERVLAPKLIQDSAQNVGFYPFNSSLISPLAKASCDDPSLPSLTADSVVQRVYLGVNEMLIKRNTPTITTPAKKGQTSPGGRLFAELNSKRKR